MRPVARTSSWRHLPFATRLSAALLLVAACASAGPPAAAPGDAEVTSAGAAAGAGFELAAGVVVAPSLGTVYLARPGGGIEAVDAVSGKPSWSSVEAARPLLVAGGRLLGQRETGPGLPLALLEAASGALLRRFDLPLPGGVRAAVDDSPQARFRLTARAAGSDAVLEWSYLEYHALGVSPPEDRPYRRREEGRLRLHLDSGAATTLDAEQPTAAAAEPLPASVERLLGSGELRARPWRSGEVLAAARQLYEPARLVLRRWRADSGEELPEVTLEEGRPVAVLAAADRRHLLVVSPLAEAARPGESYRWQIHSLATGERLARRHAARSAAPFCLLPGALLHLEPRSGRRVEDGWDERPLRLRAADPGTDAELWQRPVRDPSYRDPPPPRP